MPATTKDAANAAFSRPRLATTAAAATGSKGAGRAASSSIFLAIFRSARTSALVSSNGASLALAIILARRMRLRPATTFPGRVRKAMAA